MLYLIRLVGSIVFCNDFDTIPEAVHSGYRRSTTEEGE